MALFGSVSDGMSDGTGRAFQRRELAMEGKGKRRARTRPCVVGPVRLRRYRGGPALDPPPLMRKAGGWSTSGV